MREQGRRRSPGRFLAPLALLVAVAATVGVIAASTGSEGDGGSEPQTTSRGTQHRQQRPHRQRPLRATYTVKLNDTLEGIAEKTGVSVERLQELNPDLDPQSLVVGQKIKLRE